MISNLCGDLRLDKVPEGGAPLCATSTAILEMSPERGAMWRVGGPCARGRRAEWRVGSPHARESCFRLGVLLAVRWSVRVQQHCGDGSCTTVALRCGGACPSAPLSAVGFSSGFRHLYLRVELRLCFVSSVVVVCIEFWPGRHPNPTGHCVQLCGNLC
jgi:hypothetical protein